MYSTIKNVQYLIAMLKEKNVKNIVISPGNSHNAIVRSIEEDTFFNTYSIVDERSAAFFAVGLAQELNETIAICSTSGTAATNYLSGITEAARRKLPIVVITGDKNQYYLDQYEDQMINQLSQFKPIVKYQAVLPIIKDLKDEWYCNRILNEAFLEMNHHGIGPIHIDVPIEEGMMAIGKYFIANELPKINVINRYDKSCKKEVFDELFESIKDKRVMILYGQDYNVDEKTINEINKISQQYNCVICVDKLSNVHCEGVQDLCRADLVAQMNGEYDMLIPNILIVVGGNSAWSGKFTIRYMGSKYETWIVNPDGKVHDYNKNLTKIFEMDTKDFIELMVQYTVSNIREYRKIWEEEDNKFILPNFEYSNLYVTNKVMNLMPKNSIYNIANSTTIRIAQYFDLDDSIKVYCNRGVNGIDGCLSTFMGTTAVTDKLSFIVIGDLTFFYDMNALWNRYRGSNIRIMLVNNEGAALFHYNQGLEKYPLLNKNVAAEHFTTAKGWAENQDLTYISATNKAEFDKNIEEFLSPNSEKAIIFEVFTKKEEDARLQHEFYDLQMTNTTKIRNEAKSIIKKMIGRE